MPVGDGEDAGRDPQWGRRRTEQRRDGPGQVSHDPAQDAEGLGVQRRRQPLVQFAGGDPARAKVVGQLGGDAVGVGNADAVVHQVPSISGVNTTCTVRSSEPRTTRTSRVPPCAP